MRFRNWWFDGSHERAGPLVSRLSSFRQRAGNKLAGLARRSPWLSEQWSFYRAWRENPKGIGAILPSSRLLARAITREIDPYAGPVLELGPGTGVFTRALLRRGVMPEDLVLIERDTQLAARLRRDFPDVTVLDIDATHLEHHQPFRLRPARAAICGLPLLNLPLRLRLRIIRATFTQLERDGACYLFTYGVRCPIPVRRLERMGLRARRIETVLANVPPAHVWKITRRSAPCARDTVDD